MERDLVSQLGHCYKVFIFALQGFQVLSVIRDLDADGVKVTAYVTAHLNIDGDVYKDAAEVGAQLL